MTHATRSARNASALIAREGEAVTLPTGAARGVFFNPSIDVVLREDGSRTTGKVEIAKQSAAMLYMLSTDAESLVEKDEIIVRGTTYLVSSLEPDGYGMTVIALARPGAESGLAPEWRQWR